MHCKKAVVVAELEIGWSIWQFTVLTLPIKLIVYCTIM